MLIFVSATLSDATWQMSGLVILMTLIGGMGTLVLLFKQVYLLIKVVDE